MKINDKALWKSLFKYMKPYLFQYFICFVLMIIVVGVDLVVPRLLGLSLKYLGEEAINFNKLISLFIIGVSVVLFGAVVNYFQSLLLSYTANKIVLHIREDVFTHIQDLSHNQFSKEPVGKLVTRATSDVNELYALYANVILDVIQHSIVQYSKERSLVIMLWSLKKKNLLIRHILCLMLPWILVGLMQDIED